MALPLPKSRSEIEAIHRSRLPLAIERARQAPLLKKRLDGVDVKKLDDPEEWRKIPVLTKDELRKLTSEEFYADFCIAGHDATVEFWRSGGATGKPLFYPRSAEDMDYMLGGAFRRIWPCIGATSSDMIHDSFPMGIHPVGQLIPRSATLEGIGSVWAGAGNTTPSAVQLQLIQDLKPSILAGMSSYCLHLGNVAAAEGLDMTKSSIRKVLVSAEPLTEAKREKIQRLWGAKVYNSFGMTEGAMVSVERDGMDGMVAFSDLFYLEVIDGATGKPVPEGREGMLVMTPIWSNTITPFVRWLTGDIVTLRSQKQTDDPFSVFPLLKHALRTEGFFKIRGVNINHGDLEDFMFAQRAVTDFKGEAVTRDDLDHLRLVVEIARGAERALVVAELARAIKLKFEIAAEIEVVEIGTLAQEFEKSVKAPRFVDRRNG
ncbi:MAG: phenylacetate--CoA ligase family protein [Candidatus Eiseniibacteriota bacterium]